MRRLLFLAVVMVAVAAADAPCRTWIISPDGTGDAPSIKGALYYGADGDTVLLADGTYTGRDNTEVSYRGKAIVVKSRSGDAHACIIDCQGSEVNWSRGFLFYYGEGKDAVLEGVTIKNGYGYEGGGIWCWASSPTIRNVILVENTALYSGGGVYCGDGSSPDLLNVTIYNNLAAGGGGLYCISGSSPVVENGIIAYSRDGGSVRVADTECAPVFRCCDIYGNAGGDWTPYISDQYGLDGNISLDPLFCLDENPEQPFTVRSSSPCAPGYRLGCSSMGAAGVGCWLGISADIEIEPDVLNPRSRGRWITCYIELGAGLDPEEIDVGSVRLNDSIPAVLHPTGVGDHDGDGVEDRMVKFPRSDVVTVLAGFGNLEVRVSGEVAGVAFAGTDTVSVLCAGLKMKPPGSDAGTSVERILSVLGGGVSAGSAIIRFEISKPGDVMLSVYNVQGRLVRRLVDEPLQPDTYFVGWDGLDGSGGKVASGIYFLRLDTENKVSTGKTIIAR